MMVKNKKENMSKLSDFIDDANEGKVVIVDVHNLVFRTIFVASAASDKFSTEDEMYNYFKFLFTKTVFSMLKMFKPKNVVFALESSKNWRRSIYPDYKANRKSLRENSKINFDTFFPVLDEFLKDFQTIFTPFHYMRVDMCEADDIMGVLGKTLEDEIIIISTDRDMNQLTRKKNVKQYDPIKKKYFQSINVEKELQLKIILGDKGDNIPAIQKRCGPATAAKLLEQGLENLTELAKMNLERNRKLIDLNYIPEHITTNIMGLYNSIELKEFDGKLMYSFLVKQRMMSLVDELQVVSPILKKMKLNG
jgi:5'-3' exonuclease